MGGREASISFDSSIRQTFSRKLQIYSTQGTHVELRLQILLEKYFAEKVEIVF